MSLFAIVLASQIAVPPITMPRIGEYAAHVSYCYDPPDVPPYKPTPEKCYNRSCYWETPEPGAINTVIWLRCETREILKGEHLQLEKERKTKAYL